MFHIFHPLALFEALSVRAPYIPYQLLKEKWLMVALSEEKGAQL